MRWIVCRCAPSPSLRGAALRVWRPELLEERLVLDHAPLGGYGGGPESDAADHSAAMDDAANHSAAMDDAHHNAATKDAAHDTQEHRSTGQGGLDGPEGPVSRASNESPAPFESDKGPSNGSTNVISSGPTSTDVDEVTPTTVARGLVQSIATVVHPVAAANVGDVSVPPTGGIPSDIQAAVTHVGQVVVSSPSAVESMRAIAPNNALAAVAPNVIPRGIGSESPRADSVTPPLGHPPVDGVHPTAPINHDETTRPLSGSPEPIAVKSPADLLVAVESSSADLIVTRPRAARESLMSGIAINFDVVDRALGVALEEIDKMGGDLVAWFDESDGSALAPVAAAVLLAGGGYYYWQRRRVAQPTGANLEEPSSWLFTHLCNSPGSP